MKQVTNAVFYDTIAGIKLKADQKPHLQLVNGGVELHYIIKALNKTAGIVRNVNKKITYHLPR
jgi:hypothetical protein